MVEDCHIAFTPDLIHAFVTIVELPYIFNLLYAAQTTGVPCKIKGGESMIKGQVKCTI